MKKRPTFWIAGALVLVFLAGAAAGVFFDRLILSPRPVHRRSPSHFPSLEMMAKELSLTTEQQARIKDIFERNEKRFRDLRADINSHLEEIRNQLKSEIDSVLTPEQIEKLQNMIARHRDRARRDYERYRRSGHGRPPSGQKQGEGQ